jgi:membrane carboxypeptidase/penicillin-binding protein PbpC
MEDRMHFIFPSDGAQIVPTYDAQGKVVPVPITLANSPDSLTWLVNQEVGHVIFNGPQRFLWTPPGAGFYHLTAVDSKGGRIGVQVEVLGVR